MLNYINRAIGEILLQQSDVIDVSFESPTHEWVHGPYRPIINCYLFDIRESQLSPEEMSKAGMHKLKAKNSSRIPLYFDFSYIITTWANNSSDEQNLLFNTLEMLTRFPLISEHPNWDIPDFLEYHNVPITGKISRTEDYNFSFNDFWKASVVHPKPCLIYKITLPINFRIKQVNTIEVELRINGNIEDFSKEDQDYLLLTIAKKTNILIEDIAFVEVSIGSILVTLEVPEDAALELMRLYLGGDPFIKQFKIERIELRDLFSDNIRQLPIVEKKAVRILFLASNPKDTDRLFLDEEVREIDDVLLQKAEFRDKFEIQQQWAVRITDLQSHFLRFRPDIVHFSGHGSSSNELILQDTTGNSASVSNHTLSQLFSVLKDNIRCVVLSACYSETQAKAIAEHIDCVIGMSKAIGDQAAISFSKSFYQALGFGRSIDTAFKLGLVQIDLENLADRDVPQLLTSNNSNPVNIVFV